MDFKHARVARKLKLHQLAASLPHKYAVSTLSDFERTGAGSDRLRQDLEEFYGFRSDAKLTVALHDAAPPPLRKEVLAKLRRQVQNMEIQITAIHETLNELEK